MSRKFNISYQKENLPLLLLSITLAILVGAGIHFDYVIIALMLILVIVSAVVLWKIALKYLKYDIDWSRLLSELTVPMVLWLLFGLGGTLGFFDPEVVTKFGMSYATSTVLLTAIYVSIGAMFYIVGFRWGFRDAQLRQEVRKALSKSQFLLVLGVLLVFDWYVRFDQIRGGVYFVWLRPYSETTQALLRTTNPLYHFNDIVGPVVLVLLTYGAIMFANRRPFVFLLAIQAALILLQGQRRDVLLAAFATLLPYFSLKKVQIRPRHLLFALLFIVLFFGLIDPVIQESRLMMRMDALALTSRPEQIIVRYVGEYIPQSLRVLGNGQASLRVQQGASFTERVGGYMSYAASIHQAMIDGRAGLNLERFGAALSLVVPRSLYPDKPVIDANDEVYEHFGFGRLGYDATGTPIADVFSYLHLPGIILLFVVVGVGYGFIARHLRVSYGRLGDMIMIGIMPAAVPTGDAFGGYLASLRNVLLLIILIALVIKVSAVFLGRQKESFRSRERSILAYRAKSESVLSKGSV